jgi:enamine deaminase RidA (YjgF/YER057c/UK114 family)
MGLRYGTRKKSTREEKMAKHAIQTKRGAPPGGAYSQGWRAGDFLFVTGTGPIDPVTGELVGDDIERQTEQTIDNIAAILEADGASLGDVVKVNTHLSDLTGEHVKEEDGPRKEVKPRQMASYPSRLRCFGITP